MGNPLGLVEDTNPIQLLKDRIDKAMHHPGKIWVRSWRTEYGMHIKIIDCEAGQYDNGYQTHLTFQFTREEWSGSIRRGIHSFILNSRMAMALFEGMFDWMFDWFDGECTQERSIKKTDK